MKRLMYLCSMVALVSGFALAGGRSYAAHQGSAAGASLLAVRLCSSTPVGVPALKDLSQGIFNGVILATKQMKGAFKKAGLNLESPLLLNYAKSDGSGYSTDLEHQNALNCLGKKDTLAYIGTLNSGAALVSEPVLNRGAMAMISPANTNPSLTDPKQRAAQEPSTFAHSLSTVTYFRVVTTDNLQGPAGAAFVAKKLGAKSVFVVDDKLTYGAGLAGTFTAYGTAHEGMSIAGTGHIDSTDAASESSTWDAIGDTVVTKNPDAVYCGCDSETTTGFAKALRSKGFTKPFVGGDALYNQTWVTDNGAGATNSYATSVGPDAAHSAKAFQQAYKSAFHIAIGPYDALAFDAANIALRAILEARAAAKLKGSATAMRKAVLGYVAKMKYKGATGKTSFDKNGDTTNRVVSVYQVKSNTWAYIGKAPNPKGVNPTG